VVEACSTHEDTINAYESWSGNLKRRDEAFTAMKIQVTIF